MDELDVILLDAWNRIGEKCRRDRVQALKRSQRRFKALLSRPVRELCLVIRASDTRINPYSAAFELDWEQPRPMEAMDDPIQWALAHREAHTVTLTGKLIRQLTQPVEIPWPGVTLREAGELCGRELANMYCWFRRAPFHVDYYHEFKFPRSNKLGEDLRGRPYLWTPSPIDPNSYNGCPPHSVWGTLWQFRWNKIPEDHHVVVQRVPRLWRASKGKSQGQPAFHGWEFICPGRLHHNRESDAWEYKGCGRRCMNLYAPQTMWTLGQALFSEVDGDGGGGLALDMPEGSGLSGQWFPGLSDPVKDAAKAAGSGGGRSFACMKCWGVHWLTMSDTHGWNDFIAQISGGLLYGREVPRPLDICPIERKREKRKWRPAEERAKAKKLKTAMKEEEGGAERRRLA